ncbi:MAG: hydrogenase maturation protease [Stigonema ocellatum SAG 48.90 = DSM 106950]|nr:hydrogenase maturation protease [Stigonema ocellatum SAG 48.90 = DSM 106950]
MENVIIKTYPAILLIGYGNDLRSDDAVGQRVSDLIASWKLVNLCTLCVRQLTPELADLLAKVDVVIFVDAYPATVEQNVQVCPIELTHTNVTMGHSSNPSYLLTLTQALYGYSPQGWWITIPGVNFELGESLSPVAQRGIEIALQIIYQLIKTTIK